MPNAFYRNTSSGTKKKSERERRQAASAVPDEAVEQSADVVVSEVAPEKRGRAGEAKDEQEARPGRSLLTWNVDITPSALVTMSVLGMLLLGFTFLSGVIVGRGTLPLPQAMELEKLAPEEPVQADAAERIISQEDLHFMTSLKAREAEGVLSAVREAEKQEKAKKARAAQAAKARREAARAEAARKEAEKARAEEARKAKTTRYDYVLRVAAFREAAPAQRLAASLAKAGMKPQRHMGRSNTGLWHYVSVPMRGTADDLQAMRKKLAAFNVGDTMVISKKAVEGKKPGKGGQKRP